MIVFEWLQKMKQRKGNLIEAALHPIIVNLVSIHGSKELYANWILGSIIENIEGLYDEKKPNEFQSSDYGILYRNTIRNIICDKFGADKKHTKGGSALIFDLEKLVKVGKAYNLEINSQTQLACEEGDGGDDSDGSIKSNCPPIDSYDTENGNNAIKSSIKTENVGSNIENITKQDNDKQSARSLESSQPSLPSPNSTTNQNIYRLGHSDKWACKNCKIIDDGWFMRVHNCRGLK
jgi:hypothetical protein